jgi:RecA-family ATPase
MKTNTFDIFILEPNSKVAYINKKENIFWEKWKLYKDCNEEEKQQINLASYPSNCILFDRDLKEYSEEQIEDDYNKFIRMLRKRGIDYFYAYRSPNGYHVLAPFKDLEKYDNDLRKKLRKYYVSLFESDTAKISDRGVVSLPGRPHFKNNITYHIHDHYEGLNEFPDFIIEECKDNIKKNKEFKEKLLQDADFTDYFEKDPFFNYLKTNVIPDNTNRDMDIFPNLAIAAVRSGKPKNEIDDILIPIIQNNFPGKSYAEFEGWYSKAKNSEINDYNPVQINTWMKTYSKDKKEIYNLKGDKAKDSLEIMDIKKSEFKIYWDDELDDITDVNINWLIEDWLPEGDICFIAGKAASFKTTICMHWAYSIANGKLIFNQYKVKPCKVLYLNEENSNAITVNIARRVKKGLELENGNKNLAFSLLNNIRFDNLEDINKLIKFINDNDIKVLFFDSFRRFFSGEENDATLMNRLFNILKYIRNQTNTTILIIHHYKKNDSKGTNDIRDRMRGSSDIMNSADSVIAVGRKHGQDAFEIQHVKLRAAKEITNKLYSISNEEDDAAYIYEIEDINKQRKVITKPEQIAEDIVTYLEDNNIEDIKAKTIREQFKAESYDTITKAIRILINDNILISFGPSKKLIMYHYNKIVKK